MAAPLLLRGIPFISLRLNHHRLAASFLSPLRQSWSSAVDSTRMDEEASSVEKTTAVSSAREPPKYPTWDDPDYRKWKYKEEEILKDIEPITALTKEILHSNRYLDGERLTAEDEKVVVEKLLTYHPNSEDKIGSGLDSIMVMQRNYGEPVGGVWSNAVLADELVVDRHPQFRHSRCLFVVRTDGGWIDFSYQKCLRAYIRDKYPTHAERFIREHFKRGR